MASQINGMTMTQPGSIKGNVAAQHPTLNAPSEIRNLSDGWARLHNANHQMSTAQKQSYEAQTFLWTTLQTTLQQCGVFERRIQEYHQAYKSAMNEVDNLGDKNRDLQEIIARTEDANVALERKLEELNTVSNGLAEQNVLLSQDLQQAEGRIKFLEKVARELGHSAHTTVELSDVVVHEMDSGEEKSPSFIAIESPNKGSDTKHENMAAEMHCPQASISRVMSPRDAEPMSKGLERDGSNIQTLGVGKTQVGRVAQRRAGKKRRNRGQQSSV